MKSGKSLQELAQQLDNIRKDSKDFIVPTVKMEMTSEGRIAFQGQTVKPTGWAHSQISTYADVPKAYYDRIKDQNPGLLAQNVNHGFAIQNTVARKDGKPESRMLRTINGDLRAMLSSSFKRMDNYDLMNETLPLMRDKGMYVDSCELTERRLYVKALTTQMKADIKPGDTVQYGLVVSNSDVGSGSLRVEPLIFRLVCSNGLILPSAIKRYHVGKNQGSDDFYELLSDKTKELSEAAFWAQVRDVILASMQPAFFESQVNRLREAANAPIKNFDIPQVIELSMKAVGLGNEKTSDDMVAYLANGADGAGLSKWGLMNAFTAAAQSDKVDYDESVELERAASKILELTPNQWRTISAA